MKFARTIIATLLVVLLGAMTGLGDRAHAMLESGIGGHCDGQFHTYVSDHHADHVSRSLIASSSDEEDGAMHKGCNPFVCNVAALDAQAFQTTRNRYLTLVAWQAPNFTTLSEPDSPDKPPNI